MQKDELLAIINKLRATQKEWNTVDAKRKIAIKEMGEKAEFVKKTAEIYYNLPADLVKEFNVKYLDFMPVNETVDAILKLIEKSE